MDSRGPAAHIFTFSCMADEAGNRAGGYAAAAAAFLFWGLVPVYWKLFTGVGAGEVIAHRVLWSLVFAAALVALRGSWREAVRALSAWGEARYLLLAAVLLAVNWLTFVWAVTHDRVADTSLGYFLCPLVSVALALVLERERLCARQWIAVAFGLAGIVWLFATSPLSPAPAVLIALSWGGYGWCKRRVRAGPVASLAAETTLLAPIAAIYLGILASRGTNSLETSVASVLFFASAGVVTALPLILFAHAAQRIRLSALGFLNYLVPTVSLLLALFLYGEPFAWTRGVGFGLIWAGLAVYSRTIFRGIRS